MVVKPYYEQDGITIYHGDCRDVLPQFPDKSFDLVLTDPPYAIPTLTAQRRELLRNVGDFSIVEGYFRGWFEEIDRVLSLDGRGFVFCDSIFYPVVFRASYNSFLNAMLVWDKGRIGMGREFRRSFELILHVWRNTTEVVRDGTGHSDILLFPPVGIERQHPAEKPKDLLIYLLERFNTTRPILDPFGGSGTTAVAAKQLGRKCTLIEIEEKYVEIAIKRLAQMELTFT